METTSYYATLAVEKLTGISRTTIDRWRKAGFIGPSIAVRMKNGRTLFAWSDRDVEAIKKFPGVDTHGAVKKF